MEESLVDEVVFLLPLVLLDIVHSFLIQPGDLLRQWAVDPKHQISKIFCVGQKLIGVKQESQRGGFALHELVVNRATVGLRKDCIMKVEGEESDHVQSISQHENRLFVTTTRRNVFASNPFQTILRLDERSAEDGEYFGGPEILVCLEASIERRYVICIGKTGSQQLLTCSRAVRAKDSDTVLVTDYRSPLATTVKRYNIVTKQFSGGDIFFREENQEHEVKEVCYESTSGVIYVLGWSRRTIRLLCFPCENYIVRNSDMYLLRSFKRRDYFSCTLCFRDGLQGTTIFVHDSALNLLSELQGWERHV